MLSKKIERAICLAARLHKNQLRKDGETPYVSHCFAVACVLSQYTNEQEIIIAGLLHDVLEDVPGYLYEDIIRDFGERVAIIVQGVSEDKNPNEETDKKATWGERKAKQLSSLRNASVDVLLVCCADKIHNLRSTTNEFEETGKKIWEKFNAPIERQLWYYQEILSIMKNRISLNPIVRELEMALQYFTCIVRA